MRDCENCKNCTFKRMAYANGYINTCDCDSKMDELPLEELEQMIASNECKWFEAGKPSYSEEVCFDD